MIKIRMIKNNLIEYESVNKMSYKSFLFIENYREDKGYKVNLLNEYYAVVELTTQKLEIIYFN